MLAEDRRAFAPVATSRSTQSTSRRSTPRRRAGWRRGTRRALVVAFNAIGWIPVNIFFSAADTLTSATDYFYDYTSNDEPATLDAGDKVRVDSGPHAGEVFEYMGATQPGPSSSRRSCRTTTTRRSGQNVTVTVSAIYDYTNDSTPATLAKGKRVLIPGGTNGLIYKYVGEPADRPRPRPFDATNHPSGQVYTDVDLWLNVTPVFGGQRPSHAQALVLDSPLKSAATSPSPRRRARS